MLVEVNFFLQILTIIIGTFMIERYVLLEPAMEPKKQRIFYLISCVVTIIVYFIVGRPAQYVVLVFGALNIFLGRKKHRILGFFMIVPLIGIMNGVFAAPMAMLSVMAGFGQDENPLQIAFLIVYMIIAAVLLLFYFKGKDWRVWFSENMKNRRPNLSEYILLCVSGFLMFIFSNVVSGVVTSEIESYPLQAVNNIRLALAMYEIMAFVLSVAVIVMILQGNKRSFYHNKVSNMQFSIIATMADLVENRDDNTGGHIKRTARYVEIIGEKLKAQNAFPGILTERYLSDMIVAAPLHDIGKIHIPDAILNKPGRLTDEEFAIMKTHTTAGYQVLLQAKEQLGEFDYLNVALEMAEYHHEWWNGRGYPNAVSGEEIPLCARIMAVADVFDALIAKRCYKPAMPIEKAYHIISEESGTHFDPVVAEAFLASKAEIEKAIESLSEEGEKKS